jgi:hypothetical protein
LIFSPPREKDVLQGNAIAEAAIRRIPTAEFEVQYFELMKPTTVPNVMCGAGTDFGFLRAQASV